MSPDFTQIREHERQGWSGGKSDLEASSVLCVTVPYFGVSVSEPPKQKTDLWLSGGEEAGE